MLNIAKNVNGSEMAVVLEGRLDTTTAPQLEEEIKSSLEGVGNLVMDFASLEYISSAGLRVLLAFHKIMAKQGSMVVKNASEDVKEIFDVTGFSNILNIE